MEKSVKVSKKKIAFAIVGIVLALLCAVAGSEIYGYHHPKIIVRYMGHRALFNVESFGMGVIGGGSRWYVNEQGDHYSQYYARLIKEWEDMVYPFQDALFEEYDGRPAQVTALIENTDGHTVVTYQGYVTAETGEIVEINERFELSGILTDRLEQRTW
ncbi:MAG: hypothetical protein NC398_06505 [Acetatifactor muris]|nr:hypothetical protein [Acetatifactor muris]MCM1526600.1 hypothetical protein [Bacteroides sp.]